MFNLYLNMFVLFTGALSLLFRIPQLRWINSAQSTFLGATFIFLATFFIPWVNWVCERNVLFWIVDYVWDKPGKISNKTDLEQFQGRDVFLFSCMEMTLYRITLAT